MTTREPLAPEALIPKIEAIEAVRKGFDALDTHVVITDQNGVILYANKAVERQTGYSPDEIIGGNPADYWGGNMSQEFYENMWQTIKVEKKPFVGIVNNVRKDGQKYTQELHIYPVLGLDGEPRFFIGIEPNVGGKEAGEEFKDAFISIIENQLKTSLESIKWLIGFFTKNVPIDITTRTVLEEIYKESSGLSGFNTFQR